MNDEIIRFIRDNDGVSSRELAERFLKFKNPGETLAMLAIKGILAKDNRTYLGDDKLWHAAILPAGQRLSQDLVAINVHWLTPQGGRKVVHVSAWTIADPSEHRFDAWLENPDLLPPDEQESLVSLRDAPFDPLALDARIAELMFLCESKTPVFLSYKDSSLIAEIGSGLFDSVREKALVISDLFRCCGIATPRPLTLESCHHALFQAAPKSSSAYKSGEILAQCAWEILGRLADKGVVGIADLEACETNDIASFDFSEKSFGLADVVNAPVSPGVYGFKTKNNAFLYIGKAANLRRRLMGYFRSSDESPEKLDRIKKESYGLITSLCGSELESLIYEYRLIKKHSPILNTQITVNERSGAYAPVEDCIVLLPHSAGMSKGMSFMFRKNQKILLRPFLSDFSETADLTEDIQKFFFEGSLAADQNDFPEQEIATRWVKKYRDDLAVVFISRVTDAKDACDAMQSLWKEFVEAHV